MPGFSLRTSRRGNDMAGCAHVARALHRRDCTRVRPSDIWRRQLGPAGAFSRALLSEKKEPRPQRERSRLVAGRLSGVFSDQECTRMTNQRRPGHFPSTGQQLLPVCTRSTPELGTLPTFSQVAHIQPVGSPALFMSADAGAIVLNSTAVATMHDDVSPHCRASFASRSPV